MVTSSPPPAHSSFASLRSAANGGSGILMLAEQALSSSSSTIAGVICMAAKCRFRYNDIHGTDISAVDVPALYAKAAPLIEVSAKPTILLILPSLLVCRMYAALLRHAGIDAIASSNPLAAYHQYLSPKRTCRGGPKICMVIADWGLVDEPSGTTAQDVVQFMRNDAQEYASHARPPPGILAPPDPCCVVALCGRDVLVGNAVRNGANLFLRKPLMLHLQVLQRLLMPRAMAIPGFPAELLRQEANHEALRAVLCETTMHAAADEDETYAQEDDSRGDTRSEGNDNSVIIKKKKERNTSVVGAKSALGVPARNAALATALAAVEADPASNYLLEVTSANAASIKRFVQKIADDMDADETENAHPSSFVSNMIAYLKAHDPKHADARWHTVLQSSVKALTGAKEELRRLSRTAMRNRMQCELCWQQHRDVSTFLPEDYFLSGLSRRELTQRALQLAVRCAELEEDKLSSEKAFLSICSDSDALRQSMDMLLNHRREAQKRHEGRDDGGLPAALVADTEKKVVENRSSASAETTPGSGSGGGGVLLPSPSFVGKQQPLKSTAMTRQQSKQKLRGSANGKDTGKPGRDLRIVRRFFESRLAALETSLMVCEDRALRFVQKPAPSLRKYSVASSSQEDAPMAFQCADSWPPIIRGSTALLYHKVKALVENLLSECAMTSRGLLNADPSLRDPLSALEANLVYHLDKFDVLQEFEPSAALQQQQSASAASSPSSSPKGGPTATATKGKAAASSPRSAAAIDQQLVASSSAFSSDGKGSIATAVPATTTLKGAVRAASLLLSSGGPAEANTSGSVSWKKQAPTEAKIYLLNVMVAQANMLEARTSRALMSRRFFMWVGRSFSRMHSRLMVADHRDGKHQIGVLASVSPLSPDASAPTTQEQTASELSIERSVGEKQATTEMPSAPPAATESASDGAPAVVSPEDAAEAIEENLAQNLASGPNNVLPTHATSKQQVKTPHPPTSSASGSGGGASRSSVQASLDVPTAMRV